MKNHRSRLTALSLICSCGKHVKEPTSLFAKSRGHRPQWCNKPLLVVGLGRDGTSGLDLSPVSCKFPLGRLLSKKVGK